MSSDININNNEYNKVERCVICGCETQYVFGDHISTRKHYIEGAGQLCEECFKEIYKKNTE